MIKRYYALIATGYYLAGTSVAPDIMNIPYLVQREIRFSPTHLRVGMRKELDCRPG